MNYISYINGDDANGIGMRCTLFVAGCELACKGCHNPISWKLNAGEPYTKEFENLIIKDLQSEFIDGISISGGNPTHKRNIEEVLRLCKRVKSETGKSVWLWSGNTLEEILAKSFGKDLLKFVDVLIDGRWDFTLADKSLRWRGSSNQKIYELKLGEVINIID